MAATSTLDIQLFPSAAPRSTAGNVGICFAGGGSRAMVLAMGELRALKALGLLDQVSAISSVSGGTWAAATFTYLPAAITDDDFLGLPVAPAAITPQSLATLPANNLGRVAQNLDIPSIGEVLKACVEKGYAPWDLWQAVVGSCVLKPFGLWDVGARLYPTKYYAFTAADAAAIVARNPGLSVSDFCVTQRPRPQLFINGSMFSNPTFESSLPLPFVSTPDGVGIGALFQRRGPWDWDLGGGFIESVGMGAEFEKTLDGNRAQVSMPRRPFSLSDMVSISSAAIADVVTMKLPWYLGPVKELAPMYQYWPVGGTRTNAFRYKFADGGFVDDTGIAALLSRGVPNIIACVNCDTPISQTTIDGQVSALFGQPSDAAQAAGRISPQVFQPADLPGLVQGLWNANQVQHGPAMFAQTLQTVANPSLGVSSYTVNVLWVYNVWVDAWYDALQPAVQETVQQQRQSSKFPCYDTFALLNMTPTQVNLLAHLSCWNLQANAPMVHRLFGA